MSIWRRLIGKPKEKAPIPLEEAFPVLAPEGLSTGDIDDAINEARSEVNGSSGAIHDAEESAEIEINSLSEGETESIVSSLELAESNDHSIPEDKLPSSEESSVPVTATNSSLQMPIIGGPKPLTQVGSLGGGFIPPKKVNVGGGDDGKEPSNDEHGEETSSDPHLHDHLEDLSSLDGQILPELQVPDWRQELEFAKERYEPCDLTNHIVKVSKRRFVAKRIDFELAQSKRNAYKRFLERATRRFKEKIDEDKILNEGLRDLSQWKSQQSFSVAWKLAERINDELAKAKKSESEAISFIQNNTEFTNPEAVEQFRYFARRVILIPLVTLYLSSVIGLTYNRFEWILKFIPPFNLGLRSTLVMVCGVAAGFWLSNLWKYAKRVSRIHKRAAAFERLYREQEKKIAHAVAEHARLSQQQPMVEPILQVLAKAYRVQLQSDASVKAHATTFFDPAMLPACVTLARAEDNNEIKMAKLKRRALNVLMKPGWRTEGLDHIARIHADSRMLDSNSLSLKSLDTDSLVSARNAQKILLEAFSNYEVHNKVSRERLRAAIQNLHKEVLAKWESSDRPTVVSLRDDGFDRLSFRSSWLDEQKVSQDWIEFLSEIINEDASPFGIFNIQDKTSQLNKKELISSVAVVPHYFEVKNSKLKIEISPITEVLPMDVVVRVDVSPWANPSAFAVFAKSSFVHDNSLEIDTSRDVEGDTSA
jgi:hypothetical protein